MSPIMHRKSTPELWRPGVSTRMNISALNGAQALCVFEQRCLAGTGAPPHWHEVEEVLSVVSGTMMVQVGDVEHILSAEESAVIPARVIHGFRNIGSGELHVQAILAAPFFEAWASPGNEKSVRWRPSGEL